MAIYGSPGSVTYSVALGDLQSMLDVLPDNTSNQINAQNVRDVVAGLWEAIQGLSASISLGSSVTYTNLTASTIGVGGIPSGTTFNNQTIQQMFDNMFYPYVAPSRSLTSNPSQKEFGDTNLSVSLTSTSTAGSLPFTNRILYRPNPVTVISSPSVQTGTLVQNLPTTFTFSVTDSQSTYITTTTVTWTNKRYWGILPQSSPLASVNLSAAFSWSDVSSLSNELNPSYVMTKTITRNTSSYVFFMWPTNAVDLSSNPAKVTIGGFGVNAFTKTRSNAQFTNFWGYTTGYDVWRLDTVNNDTLQYIIST